jgi:hypothetical protein
MATYTTIQGNTIDNRFRIFHRLIQKKGHKISKKRNGLETAGSECWTLKTNSHEGFLSKYRNIKIVGNAFNLKTHHF